MTERRLTFIDVDENPLIVCLKDDRVQLLVVDSRPELEAGELRAFAAALFAAYGGAPLAGQLAAARDNIARVRDELALSGGAESLLAALDGSLSAISSVARRMTEARPGHSG